MRVRQKRYLIYLNVNESRFVGHYSRVVVIGHFKLIVINKNILNFICELNEFEEYTLLVVIEIILNENFESPLGN